MTKSEIHIIVDNLLYFESELKKENISDWFNEELLRIIKELQELK